MSRILALALIAGLPVVATVGCQSAPKTQAQRQDLDSEARESVNHALALDPSLKPVLDRSAGYAVFPKAGKGGLIIGGAYGNGVLFEHGVITGYCTISEGSIGLTVGGEEFSELLVFQTPQAVNDFKRGDFTVKADASAVALKADAAGKTVFRNDVALFIYDSAGLMADASVGGESFKFTPINLLKQEAQPAGETMDQTPSDSMHHDNY